MKSRASRSTPDPLSALAAIMAGAGLGLWFVLEPLTRFGSNIVRAGMSAGQIIGWSAAVGAGLSLLCWLLALLGRPLLIPLHRRSPLVPALAGTAGTIAALLVFWSLRMAEADLGANSRALYFLLGGASGIVAALLGGWITDGAVRGRPGARVATAVVFLAGIGLAVALIGIERSNPRWVKVARGEMTWSEARFRRVYLITIDALRADHLGCYDYSRDTSPVIDQLAAEGLRYAVCYSQGNRSELSFGSLLTGMIPSTHGVSRTGGDARALSPDGTTLAEMMAERGYTTVGLLTNPYLKRGFGLDQGFHDADEFYYHYRNLVVVRLLEKLRVMKEPLTNLTTIPKAEVVTDRALRRLARYRDEPLFAFVHYMDVHHPYLPPPEIESKFRDPAASDTGALAVFSRVTGRGQKVEAKGHPPFAEADTRRLADLYDGAIAYTDREIGRLLRGLEAMGMLDDALIIVTADHGDEFAEHGYFFHSNPVPTEILTRVPLILHAPGLAPAVIETPVSHIDVIPTILALLGDPAESGFPGRPLPLRPAADPDTTRLLLSEGPGRAVLRTWIGPNLWKIVSDRATASQLYDLTSDPEERHDVSTEQPELTARLTRELLTILADSKRGSMPSVPLDRSLVEELKSLGYIGGHSHENGAESEEEETPAGGESGRP